MTMRVCVLAYTYYETDNRVIRYAETLVKRGDHVDAIVLSQTGQRRYEKINGVNVYRIQRRVTDEKRKITYLAKIAFFFIKSFFFLTVKHMIKPYNLIHVHSVPDFEVFAALMPKLTGAKIILDIHDIVPELYASKFKVSETSVLFKALKLIERISIAFSNHVIIANHIWYNTLLSRSVEENKCTAILNYPDTDIFYKRDSEKDKNKFIMIYPGTLNWHQGVDIAVKAFAKIKDQVPEAEFHIYGSGPLKCSIINMLPELGLENRVQFKGLLPIYKIASVMANADLGVVPKRSDSFGNEAFSTKILEFMALGIPVIVSETKIDKYYFNDSLVKFFKPEDEKDLAACILLLMKDKKLREQLTANSLKYIEKNNWKVKENIYLNIVDSLTDKSKN